MHHSREPRNRPVQCVWCRKPTFEFDRRCADCTVAAETPPDESTYFLFDLDTQRVPVPSHRVDAGDVLTEILTALEAS